MNAMKKFVMEAPWYTYRKKVNALFERDGDIRIGEIYTPEDDSADYAFDIEVTDHEKFLALDRVLAKQKKFGNVTLAVTLFDEENANGIDDHIALYETVFKDNPIVKDVKNVTDFTGTRLGFVRFQPEVIQFHDDNTGDYSGNWNGLAEDIAREVFVDGFQGVFFCTADKQEG